MDTGVTNSTETNSAGNYRFPSLGPGTYKVTATVKGFASVTEANIQLTALSVRDVSLTLRPADVTASVEVQASATAVDTDEAQITSVTTERQVEELPIQGRNIYTVANQTPGVTGTGLMGQTAANTDIFYATTTPAVVANGAPNHGNTYLLDGISLDDSPSGGDAKLVPNPDSVQEVVVTTSDYSAQFGKAASLVTQITSKAGTNKLHGSVFEQYQSSKWQARNEFQNYDDPLNGYITPTHRDEFGGSVGGPIRKDKTFIFGSWDQVISQSASTGSLTVEDPAFVSWMSANQPGTLPTTLLTSYHPVVSTPSAVQTVADVNTTQGYTNNPAQNCNLTTDPNQIGPLGMPCGMGMLDVVNGSSLSIHNGYQYNFRLDQNFSNDRIYANMYRTHLLGPWDNGVRRAFDINFPQDAWYGAVNYTHTFSPSVVNEMGFGYTRTSVDIPCNDCALLPTGVNGIPGFGDGFAPVGFAQNDFHWRDMVSIIHGKHALKTGFEWFHNQDYAPFTVPDNRQQSWNFQTIFDFAADNPTQYGTISFDPTTGGVANNDRHFRDSTYGAYIQDDWKVRADLTLNLGLRWDATSNPSEPHGTLSTLTVPVRPRSYNRSKAFRLGSIRIPTIAGPSSIIRKHILLRGSALPGGPSALTTGQSAAGTASSLIAAGIRTGAILKPPTRRSTQFTANINNPSAPQPPAFVFCGAANFPYNCPLPPGLTTTLPPLNSRGGFGNFDNIGGPDPHLKMAYAENLFLGVQHSFRSHWIAEVDYVHSNGIHEYSISNLNRVDGVKLSVNPSGGFTETLGPLPNPYFGPINYTTNRAGSNYNGFTSFVRKQFSAGFSFQVALTLQKTIDLMSTVPGQQKGAEYSVVVDAYNVAAQRAVSSQDVPKQLSFNGLWQIPTYGITSPLAKTILGGWQISALGTLVGGLPQSVYTTAPQNDFNLDGNNYDFPDVPSFGKTIKGISRSRFLGGVFTASQFPLPVQANGVPTGVEGNLGRNTFRGPGFAQTDAALAKNTHIPWFPGEGADFQVRLDLFNAFNRVNLQNWDTNLADGTFGKALGASQARTLQVGAKLTF